jgi:hypothetical protein
MFGRCDDPVEPHYVAELELVCKKCKAFTVIYSNQKKKTKRTSPYLETELWERDEPLCIFQHNIKEF